MTPRTLYFGAAILVIGLFVLLFWSGTFGFGTAPSDAGPAPASGEGTSPLTAFPQTEPSSATGTVPVVTNPTASGMITNITTGGKIIHIADAGGALITLTLAKNVVVENENGDTASSSYLRAGFTISAEGTSTKPDALTASRINVLRAPNIIVSAPSAQDLVGSPVVIQGAARVFESQFSYRLLAADGTLLASGSVHADAPDAGEYGPFSIRAAYTAPAALQGTIEVFNYSAKDGSEVDKVSIPVRLRAATSSAS